MSHTVSRSSIEKGYTNLVHFLDDGISGVTMDRPGFVEMIQQLEQGKTAAVPAPLPIMSVWIFWNRWC